MGNLKLSRYLINYDDDCTRFITKLYAVKCFIKNIYVYIHIFLSNREIFSTICVFRIDRRHKTTRIKLNRRRRNAISYSFHKGTNKPSSAN